MNMLKNLFNGLLDLIYVEEIKCILCEKELDSKKTYCICEDCFKKLPFITGKICVRCGAPNDNLSHYCKNCKGNRKKYFKFARAPFKYDGAIIKMIHDLKYNKSKYLAKYIEDMLVDTYISYGFNCDMVIPVPLNEKRLKERGFNQSEIIVKNFGKRLNIELNTTALIRKKYTPTQTNLKRAERMTNLKDAFKVTKKSEINNKRVLLIDDVFTTGSTMEECAKTLIEHGAKEVFCLTIAKVCEREKEEKQSVKKRIDKKS